MGERSTRSRLHVRVSAAGGQELYAAKVPSDFAVRDLKEELLLLLWIPRDQQHLTLNDGQCVQEDTMKLKDLHAMKQEEMELYRMLISESPKPPRAFDLDFILFVTSGFYLLHWEEKPKFRATKLPLSFPLLALNQRIFVEEVLEAPPTTPLYVGDEIREVNHRPVSSLKKGEFFQLFDQALYGGVFKLHRGSLDCYFQNRRSPEGTSVSAELSVFCIIASMSDEEVLALRVAGGTTAGELKQQVERQLHVPTFCQQLVHERRALEDTAVLTSQEPIGLRLILLRLALFTQEELGHALASGIHADLGLAFCDPAFLPPGRVAVAAVAPAAWLEILQFLGEEDFDDLADGQVVAVLPRDDYDALVRLGPLNFLFHSADVHRSEPHIPQELEQPLDPPDVTTDELPTTSVAPLSTARPERPFRRAPARAKPKATG